MSGDAIAACAVFFDEPMTTCNEGDVDFSPVLEVPNLLVIVAFNDNNADSIMLGTGLNVWNVSTG